MKVQIKIEHDPDWRSDLRKNLRYWVHLSDGKYFPIFSGYAGQWYQCYAPHMDYPCPEQAIMAALQHLYAQYDKRAQWKKCRAKVQTFTFTKRNYSRIRLPRLRKSKPFILKTVKPPTRIRNPKTGRVTFK